MVKRRAGVKKTREGQESKFVSSGRQEEPYPHPPKSRER